MRSIFEKISSKWIATAALFWLLSTWVASTQADDQHNQQLTNDTTSTTSESVDTMRARDKIQEKISNVLQYSKPATAEVYFDGTNEIPDEMSFIASWWEWVNIWSISMLIGVDKIDVTEKFSIKRTLEWNYKITLDDPSFNMEWIASGPHSFVVEKKDDNNIIIWEQRVDLTIWSLDNFKKENTSSGVVVDKTPLADKIDINIWWGSSVEVNSVMYQWTDIITAFDKRRDINWQIHLQNKLWDFDNRGTNWTYANFKLTVNTTINWQKVDKNINVYAWEKSIDQIKSDAQMIYAKALESWKTYDQSIWQVAEYINYFNIPTNLVADIFNMSVENVTDFLTRYPKLKNWSVVYNPPEVIDVVPPKTLAWTTTTTVNSASMQITSDEQATCFYVISENTTNNSAIPTKEQIMNWKTVELQKWQNSIDISWLSWETQYTVYFITQDKAKKPNTQDKSTQVNFITKAILDTPDNIEFHKLTWVVLWSTQTSEAKIISWMNVASNVTIKFGKYRISTDWWVTWPEEFIDVQSKIKNWDAIQLQQTANSFYSWEKKTEITIGKKTFNFTTITVDEPVWPVIVINQPTQPSCNPCFVAPVNHEPTVVDDTSSTAFETAVTKNLLENDSDSDWDALSINWIPTVVNWDSVWIITVWNNWEVTFTPATWFSWDAIVNYTILDWKWWLTSWTWTITVSEYVDAIPPTAPTLNSITGADWLWQPWFTDSTSVVFDFSNVANDISKSSIVAVLRDNPSEQWVIPTIDDAEANWWVEGLPTSFTIPWPAADWVYDFYVFVKDQYNNIQQNAPTWSIELRTSTPTVSGVVGIDSSSIQWDIILDWTAYIQLSEWAGSVILATWLKKTGATYTTEVEWLVATVDANDNTRINLTGFYPSNLSASPNNKAKFKLQVQSESWKLSDVFISAAYTFN